MLKIEGLKLKNNLVITGISKNHYTLKKFGTFWHVKNCFRKERSIHLYGIEIGVEPDIYTKDKRFSLSTNEYAGGPLRAAYLYNYTKYKKFI
jgi:hypothetical protein